MRPRTPLEWRMPFWRNITFFRPRLAKMAATLKPVMMQASYSRKAEELISKFGREIAEISLKYISWSLMIAALQFAYIKSGNKSLSILLIIIKIMLWIFLYCNVMRLDYLFFSPARMPVRIGASVIFAVLNVIVIQGLYIGGIFLSDAVIKAIVDLQLLR
jgi:hypothetical protein